MGGLEDDDVRGTAILMVHPQETIDDAASRRLQLAAENGGSWAVVFRSLRAQSQPSAAALRIRVMAGHNGTDLGILKNRGGRPAFVQDYASALDH